MDGPLKDLVKDPTQLFIFDGGRCDNFEVDLSLTTSIPDK